MMEGMQCWAQPTLVHDAVEIPAVSSDSVVMLFTVHTQLATSGHIFVKACLSGKDSKQNQDGYQQHLDASHCHGLNASWPCIHMGVYIYVDTALQKTIVCFLPGSVRVRTRAQLDCLGIEPHHLHQESCAPLSQ